MKKCWKLCVLMSLLALLAGCGKKNLSGGVPAEDTQYPSKRYITVGFSQLGAESDWRNANTISMKGALTKENGYELFLEDGQQKQSNQIMAIRKFIQQEVDYIVLAPVTETGWDTVLQEAKDAHIPVIIVDRMVDVSDRSLFTCFVGSDFELEGKKVAEWLNQYTIAKGIDASEVKIVNIQGNLGATAQIGRTKGLTQAAETNGWQLLAELPGDFTQTRGKEVMETFLRQYPDLNVVYCENDNEAFGAIEAIEEAGRKVGAKIDKGQIMVLSFDGVNEQALNDVAANRISCIGECNPLHGPRVQAIIEALENGETPDKLSFVDEGIFVHDTTVSSIWVDGVEYPVTPITEEQLNDESNK